jgi:hypothetical protein
LPLSVCRRETKVEPIRYHITLKNGKRFAISKYDPEATKELNQAAKQETCIEEKCFLCHAYGLALMPNLPRGETLIFSYGDYDRYYIDSVVVVVKEFDPYDPEINSLEDVVKMGYGQKVYFTELWEEE